MATTNPKTPEQSKELSVTEAASLVKRTVTETDKDGKKSPKEVGALDCCLVMRVPQDAGLATWEPSFHSGSLGGASGLG